jgi:hypothetical protein
MKIRPNKFSSVGGRQILGLAYKQSSRTRGVALIITLILLLLLSAASLAIVLLVSSDTMINGFYRSYRGSFYAADSGVNVVVEAMASAINTAGVQAANPPLSVGGTAIPATAQTWANVGTGGAGEYPAALTSSYTPFTNAYYTMGDPGSWKGQFKMLVVNGANPDTNAVLGQPQFRLEPSIGDANSCLPTNQVNCPNGNPNDHNYTWTFSYPYEVTVKGQSTGTEGEEVIETGTIVYTSISGTAAAGGPPPFSKWAAFITNFGDCQGPLVPGTMTGPFFTDGQWNFGNFTNPGYTFTGSIAQAGAQASWWNNNNCTDSATVPGGFRAPSFPAGGLQVGAKSIVAPTNSYSQAAAVLDAKGAPPCTVTPCSADPAPTQSQMSQVLQTVGGTAYPSSGSAPTGVYFPYYTSGTSPSGQTCSVAHPCYGSNPAATWTDANNNTVHGDGYGGGFYINGNASITLIASTGGDSTTNATQTYKITQGSTNTTIVVDSTAGTTTVTSGGTTLSLQGIPAQLDPNAGTVMNSYDPSGAVVSPSLMYVNGAITGLTGTYDNQNNPLGAIQNNMGVTIAASGNISITGDLTYATLPVTVPSDASVSGTNAGVLGVYTNQNISLYPDPNGDLTVDGSLAAIGGSSGNSGFATPGGSIGNWTIVGGRAEDHAHSVSIGSGNTYYDTRFGNNFGPPWFPTAVPQPGQVAIPSSESVSVTRGTWSEYNRNGNGNY